MKTCPTCGEELCEQTLYIINGDCWKCGKKTKVAVLLGIMGTQGPEDFSEKEKKIAINNGANLKIKYSKTVGDSYFANECTHCGALIGDFYLGTQYLMPADNGEYEKQKFVTDEYCVNCDYEIIEGDNSKLN